MSRDGLPRAYLRIDPNIDQHPDPLAMLKAMCAAARQPVRGRFREPAVLQRAVGTRQYRAMVDRGDVVPAVPGPGIYLAGWDEWQEGDHSVAERMRRMRARRRSTVTPPSPDRNGVTTDAGSSSLGDSSSGVDVGVDPPIPPPSGGRRSNGTNPRAIAAAEREAEERRVRERAREATRRRIAELQATG